MNEPVCWGGLAHLHTDLPPQWASLVTPNEHVYCTVQAVPTRVYCSAHLTTHPTHPQCSRLAGLQGAGDSQRGDCAEIAIEIVRSHS